MSIEIIISMIGIVIAIIGLSIATVAAWAAIKQNNESIKQTKEAIEQNKLTQLSIQAQTFLTVVNTAREICFSKGMDIIRTLNYSDYHDFKSKESKEAQEQIRAVVDFLNDLMHLIEHSYLSEEQVIKIYYSSIRDCSEHLLPWWVDGFRKEQKGKHYYLRFTQLCDKVYPNSNNEISKAKKIKS